MDFQANVPARTMTTAEALEVLAKHRQDDQLVVTHQRSAREWLILSQHPLDFNYNPSTMGGAVPLALGLALAQPSKEVICITGDGSLLMNLGSLVSVVDARAANLTIVLLDNGTYEVTGGQKIPRGDPLTDFGGLARAVGFPNVRHFWDAALWREQATSIFASPGPRFVWLMVRSEPETMPLMPARPVRKQAARLRAALVRAPDR